MGLSSISCRWITSNGTSKQQTPKSVTSGFSLSSRKSSNRFRAMKAQSQKAKARMTLRCSCKISERKFPVTASALIVIHLVSIMFIIQCRGHSFKLVFSFVQHRSGRVSTWEYCFALNVREYIEIWDLTFQKFGL